MIVTQTPLRVSFLGGGTDFRAFYALEDGCVLSSAIDKYIFVVIKERFDQKIRVSYTRTEMVDSVDEIQHDLVRECLRKTGITHGVEISTMADIPSEGSGLGSSSSLTVGLLNAMYNYCGTPVSVETLAREACEIEINTLGKPIGKQDQYIAAYGDLRTIRFRRDEVVDTNCLGLTNGTPRRLAQNLMLFYTNIARKSETVLAEQVDNINARLEVLRLMKGLVEEAQHSLRAGKLDEFGAMLDQGWQAKKKLASRITNNTIEEMYATARRAGAAGGKIAGAGGGGFLLLYCRPDNQESVRSALYGLRELPFALERDGSKVLFNYRRHLDS